VLKSLMKMFTTVNVIPQTADDTDRLFRTKSDRNYQLNVNERNYQHYVNERNYQLIEINRYCQLNVNLKFVG
jgi:hypothetical protein